MRTLLLLLLGPLAASADALILKDGRKLSGPVTEKDGVYEIKIQGETLAFSKDEVQAWIKKPKEMTAEADRLIEDAKKIYLEAVEMKDAKAADARFREALPLVQKARDIYAEARDLFPDGYPELDEGLVTTMKLMRLVRERVGSQYGGEPTKSPVTAKKDPPKTEPKTEPKEEPKTEPKTEPKPTVSTWAEALEVLAGIERRSDAASRAGARDVFRARGGDYACAAYVLCVRSEADWGLAVDIVEVGSQKYAGRLVRKSDTSYKLVLPQNKELLVRKMGADWLVTPPGAPEAKASGVTLREGVRTGTGAAFDAYLAAYPPASFESLDSKKHVEAARLLAARAKELRATSNVEILLLFSCAHAASVPVQELEPLLADLGLQVVQGAIGTREGIAIADFRRWFSEGEYDLGAVQFHREYGDGSSVPIRYAHGFLLLAKAIVKQRNFERAYEYFEKWGKKLPDRAGAHFLALAKTLRDVAVCKVCTGESTLRCNICKGQGRADFTCSSCNGRGKVQTMRGDVACKPCKGAGGWKNAECPKCKGTGKVDCKARGCDRPKPAPKFEDVADAYACVLCRETGLLLSKVAVVCPECLGIGMTLHPKSDPKKTIK